MTEQEIIAALDEHREFLGLSPDFEIKLSSDPEDFGLLASILAGLGIVKQGEG